MDEVAMSTVSINHPEACLADATAKAAIIS